MIVKVGYAGVRKSPNNAFRICYKLLPNYVAGTLETQDTLVAAAVTLIDSDLLVGLPLVYSATANTIGDPVSTGNLETYRPEGSCYSYQYLP